MSEPTLEQPDERPNIPSSSTGGCGVEWTLDMANREIDRLRTELAAALSRANKAEMALKESEIGDFSCASCGFGMKEPCEHWKENPATDCVEGKCDHPYCLRTRGDQWAALCEKMKLAIQRIREATNMSTLGERLAEASKALTATPASALAEVRAQAVEDFIESLEDGTHGAMESPDFDAKFSIEQLYARAAALKVRP